MAPSSAPVPEGDTAVRPTQSRSICNTKQLAASTLLLQVSDTRGGGSGRAPVTMAERPAIRLPSASHHTPSDPEAPGPSGRADHHSTSLAPQALVCGSQGVIYLSALASPLRGGHAEPGTVGASRPSVAPTDRLALERSIMKQKDYDDDVILVMEASRRPSTQRIYAATWKTFCNWCVQEGLSPTRIPLSRLLRFLKKGLAMGLSPNTLRRQVAALSSVLSCPQAPSLGQLPDVKRFLRGASNTCPPPVHRFPTWDLPRVLQSLTGPPYEPLRTAPLRYLSYKVTFLLAVTSARRVSELSALSTRQDLCIFHTDKVVLRLDPLFLPKINTSFHRSEELVLPSFCPSPRHPRERLWHTLDVRRALRIYVDRTRQFRRSEALLVAFIPRMLGQRVSPTTIGRWIRGVIAKAYDLSSLPRPQGITAHSTRSAATTAAWATQVPIQTVLRAATWTSPSTFIRHYKVDEYAAAEATFGRRVLEQVCQQPH